LKSWSLIVSVRDSKHVSFFTSSVISLGASIILETSVLSVFITVIYSNYIFILSIYEKSLNRTFFIFVYKCQHENPPPPKSKSIISRTRTPSAGVATLSALTYKTYEPLETEEKIQKQLDLQRRIECNKKYEDEKQEENKNKATWTDVNPMKRVLTVRKSLNKLNGGRKRKGTKKKRHNKTKKQRK
jgi:hypothetical protein